MPDVGGNAGIDGAANYCSDSKGYGFLNSLAGEYDSNSLEGLFGGYERTASQLLAQYFTPAWDASFVAFFPRSRRPFFSNVP